MSNSDAKPKLDLDLESAFLPAWAQKSTEDNPYAKFEGRDRDYTNRDGRGRNRGDGSGRPPRPRNKDPRNKDRRQGPESRDGNRPSGGGSQRAGGGGGGQSSGKGHPARGSNDRGGGRSRPQGRAEGRGFQGRGQHRDRPRRSRQEILASLPQLKTQIIPEAKGVSLLAKRIRLQGRAYPLFDIAGLILQSPERYHMRFTSQTPPKDQEQQKIWLCKLDQTVWLDEAEAVQHVLQKYLEDFYSAERTETAPPKGSFNFVAQCGLSGIVLGPPNYHGYQARLRELHEERYSRMDFEHFKSKVKIVQNEEVVNKWLEDQSWTTEYADKNDAEAKKLHSLEEVEANFRDKYYKDAIECVNSAQISGDPKDQMSRPIRDLIRFHVDDQTRFPLQLATELSQQFTRQGLQFFKVNKTVTHVSVSRPHYLDLETTPVSDMVKRIVQFVEKTKNCTRVKVLEALAPVVPTAEPAASAEVSTAPEVEEYSETEASASDASNDQGKTQTESVEQKTGEPAAAEPVKAEPALTPEQAAVTTDLHWLIHQGHVIEFSNGKLETAKKPKEQPKKKAAKNGGKSSNKKPSGEVASKGNSAEKTEKANDAQSESAEPTKPASGQKQEEEVQPVAETSQPESNESSEPVVTSESSSEEGQKNPDADAPSTEAVPVTPIAKEPKANEEGTATPAEPSVTDAESDSKSSDS
jgi:hypothetical protein